MAARPLGERAEASAPAAPRASSVRKILRALAAIPQRIAHPVQPAETAMETVDPQLPPRVAATAAVTPVMSRAAVAPAPEPQPGLEPEPELPAQPGPEPQIIEIVEVVPAPAEQIDPPEAAAEPAAGPASPAARVRLARQVSRTAAPSPPAPQRAVPARSAPATLLRVTRSPQQRPRRQEPDALSAAWPPPPPPAGAQEQPTPAQAAALMLMRDEQPASAGPAAADAGQSAEISAPPAPAAQRASDPREDADRMYEEVVERLRRDLMAERERMGDLLGDLL